MIKISCSKWSPDRTELRWDGEIFRADLKKARGR
jgi:hypothetical protein